MTWPLTLACVWFVGANLGAMFPSRRNHWPFAYGLIAVGIPILGAVVYQHGPWVGLLVMAAAMSVLRWPVIYLFRWIKRGGKAKDADA
ncbi:Protein of unknown function [Thalassovita litoralis]|jgi:hypothetical protein|uniref:DUF2484 family protein n=1 Tax=Thalassovita litoralis TaxID=1010611 RepID=A0A521B4S9_9RHOB|nr:DUF2484 family protein [Thalassovita litoralis]SMO42079.1 Protein of unknown function [Thalassovita litoralis]